MNNSVLVEAPKHRARGRSLLRFLQFSDVDAGSSNDQLPVDLLRLLIQTRCDQRITGRNVQTSRCAVKIACGSPQAGKVTDLI
jgi:hypothetical protein